MDPEQLRILDDAASSYDVWVSGQRALQHAGPPLVWKSNAGRDHLYERRGGLWGRSRGVRSAETEALFERSALAIAQATAVVSESEARLAVLAAQYRALRMPRVHPTFGAICREADYRGLLGATLLVVGTNAMPAYEVEAQERFDTQLTATQDCDLAWTGPLHLAIDASAAAATPVYSVLKTVDPLFTVNQEKAWQARNASGYEVEVLLAPSRAAEYPVRDPLRPIQLPEQEWLLRGRPVSHVVFDLQNLPVRIVAPDPRWMALHKLWLATKPGRNPLKVAKDRAQGEMLARKVVRAMRGYPVDAEFIAAVPEELKGFLPRFAA